MNILFIFPTKLDKNDKPIKYKKAFIPPLALAILAGMTPRHHRVKIVNDIVEEIDFSDSYDLVGISAMTSQSLRAYQIADRFRSLGVKVIIGGIHSSFLPDEAKAHADSVIIGQSENLWEQILSDAENNKLEDFYKETESPDLQRFIMPDWSTANLGIYPKPFGYRKPMMPVYTTRGCPYGCKFCSVTKFFGKDYKFRPVEHVLKEVDTVNSELYFFVDDNIACNPAYSEELFKALKKRNIRWMSQISTTVLKKPSLFKHIADSGCKGLLIGIETINNKTLKSVGKGFNKYEQYKEVFARFREVKVPAYAFIIIGLDDDTEETFEQTVEFLNSDVKAYHAIFFMFTPLPGTDLFNDMDKEKRLLTKNWSQYDLSHIVFQPKQFSQQGLIDAYWRTMKRYYSPKNILRRIRNNYLIFTNPAKDFIENYTYGTMFQKAFKAKEHPLNGGFGRL